jgi:hypothetical protein
MEDESLPSSDTVIQEPSSLNLESPYRNYEHNPLAVSRDVGGEAYRPLALRYAAETNLLSWVFLDLSSTPE